MKLRKGMVVKIKSNYDDTGLALGEYPWRAKVFVVKEAGGWYGAIINTKEVFKDTRVMSSFCINELTPVALDNV